MRKWKDNQNQLYSKNMKLIFTGLSGFIIIESLQALIFSGMSDLHAFLNIGAACFVLWGVWTGGFYKILRWWALRQTRKKDNKFDYFHT